MRYAVRMTEMKQQTEAPAVVVYKGTRFRRYPNSERRSDRVYYTPGIADRRKGVQRLHQEIWKDAHGVDVIPLGYHVHHVDEDPFNNDPANLDLLLGSDHLRKHAAGEKWTEARQAWIKAGQEAARAWHSSEEGLELHRELGHKSWEAAEEESYTCQRCGREFETRVMHNRTRFCSPSCKSAERRASGVDDETRACRVCGTEFTVNRYSKKSHCSRKCAAVTTVAKRSAG